MRADRLVAIVLLLQAHGQLTAAQLADLLETSERTVRRDLDALCMAGVPLYSQRGRGGGWALLGGHRLDLTGLTVDEARALFLVAGAHSANPGSTAPGLRSALRKVLMALPEPLRAQAEAATQSTVIDPRGWGRPADEEPPSLEPLRAAVLARLQVDLDYAKPGSEPSRRRVHPYGLVAKGGVWYLLAGTEDGRRTYRLSRVRAVTVTDEPVTLPEGFDLAGEWASAQRDFADRLRLVDVEVDVADSAVLGVTAAFRGWAGVVEAEADNEKAAEDGLLHEGDGGRGRWRRFIVSVPHVRAAAAHLAAFGATVRVVAPLELRDELARLGRELVAANEGGPAPQRGDQLTRADP